METVLSSPYDKYAAELAKQTGAEAAVVIVFFGKDGHGLSAVADDNELIVRLPDLLDTFSARIREEIKKYLS